MIYLSLYIQMAILSTLQNLTFHILFWQFEIMRRATNPDFRKPENLNHLTFIFFIPENLHFHDYVKWLSLKYILQNTYFHVYDSCFCMKWVGLYFWCKKLTKVFKIKIHPECTLVNSQESFWALLTTFPCHPPRF